MSSIYKSSQSHKYNIAKLFLGAFSSTVCCIHKAVLSTSLHITARTMLLWFVLFFLGLSEQTSHLVSRSENQGNIVFGGVGITVFSGGSSL